VLLVRREGAVVSGDLGAALGRLEALAGERRLPSDLRRPSDGAVLDALVDVVIALVRETGRPEGSDAP
jgi:hypothetical protein